MQDTCDSQLLKAAQAGDRFARNQLALDAGPIIGRTLAGFGLSTSDYKDATQDAVVKVLEGIQSLRDPDNFGPWVVVVARNAGCDFLADRKAQLDEPRKVVTRGGPIDRSPEDCREIAPYAERRLHALMVREIVLAALEKIGSRPREVLRLFHFEGKSSAEIARSTGLPVNNVLQLLGRARKKLAEHLPKSITLVVALASLSPILREGA